MECFRIKFRTVRVFPAHDISCEFDQRHLHAEAYSEEGYSVDPGVLRCQDHPLCAPAAKASGDDHSIDLSQFLADPFRFLFKFLRIHPLDTHLRVIGKSSVMERLHDAEIGVVQLSVFAHQRYCDFDLWILHCMHDPAPVGQIGLGTREPQTVADHFRQMLIFHHERDLIN